MSQFLISFNLMKNKNFSLWTFYFLLIFFNSCILESSTNLEQEKRKPKLLSNSIVENKIEHDFPRDTINYNLLKMSMDSIDIELLKLIRTGKEFSPSKLIENVQILIEKGADPNNNVKENWSSKRIVARVPILKHFVKRKYNTGVRYTTAFHEAVYSGDISLVDELYNLGFNADIPSKNKVFPIDLALTANDELMIDFLIKKGANVKLADLSFSQNIDVIIKLVSLGANTQTIDINFALEEVETLEMLIKLKPNLTSVALNFKKIFENPDVFDLLIDNGLNPNIEGGFPFRCSLLYGAIKFGTLENMKKIVSKGGDYRAECKMQFYSSPLIASIKIKDTTKINYFVDLGLSLNTKDWKNDTPLIEAIDTEDEKLINFLIKKGAKVNYVLNRAETHVMYAVKREKYIAVEVLIENGASLNSIEKYGKTCLVYAIENNDLAMTRLLLENKADKTIKYKGKSLHQFASEEQASSKIIELLK